MLSARMGKERHRFDQRILGDGDFVKRVLVEANDFTKKNLRLEVSRPALPSLAQRVGEVHKISLGELHSGSRRRARAGC